MEVRRFAVSMIGLVEADLQDVMQPLIAALADPIRLCVAQQRWCWRITVPLAAEVLPHLERLLADDEFNRVTAVHAMLCIAPSRTEELIPLLAEALSNGDKTVRHRAAQVLGEIPAAGALRFTRWSRLLMMTTRLCGSSSSILSTTLAQRRFPPHQPWLRSWRTARHH